MKSSRARWFPARREPGAQGRQRRRREARPPRTGPADPHNERMTAAGLPLTGRVCVVTGASSGIGKAASIALAKLGASVVLVCRDRVRGEAAMGQITSAASGSLGAPSLELADLASLGQVRALAARLAGLPRIDVLVNNAGLIGARRRTTADGFEYTMAVNHLAPFLLTNL